MAQAPSDQIGVALCLLARAIRAKVKEMKRASAFNARRASSRSRAMRQYSTRGLEIAD